MNGRNRKFTAAMLGIVPYAGIAGRLVRGSDIRVEPNTQIETVLLRSATVVQAPVNAPEASFAAPGESPVPRVDGSR